MNYFKFILPLYYAKAGEFSGRLCGVSELAGFALHGDRILLLRAAAAGRVVAVAVFRRRETPRRIAKRAKTPAVIQLQFSCNLGPPSPY